LHFSQPYCPGCDLVFSNPRADPRAPSLALRELILNQDLRLILGQNGRKRVLEHFSWNKVAEKTLDVYQATVRGYGTPQMTSTHEREVVEFFTTDSKPALGGIAEYLHQLCEHF